MSDSRCLVSRGRNPKITTILAIIVIVWSLSGLGIWWLMPTWETRGAFGDMFGAANALFQELRWRDWCMPSSSRDRSSGSSGTT